MADAATTTALTPAKIALHVPASTSGAYVWVLQVRSLSGSIEDMTPWWVTHETARADARHFWSLATSWQPGPKLVPDPPQPLESKTRSDTGQRGFSWSG